MLREQLEIVKRWTAIGDTSGKNQQKGRKENLKILRVLLIKTDKLKVVINVGMTRFFAERFS